MAAALFHLPTSRIIDSNGIADGATLTFYDTGTLTPRAVYTTDALSVEHSNPLTVAAGAAVPNIYLDDAYTYRCIVKNAAGTTIDDIDPYTGTSASGVTFLQSGTGAVSRTIQSKLRDEFSAKDFGVVGDGTTNDTAALTLALDAAAAAGADLFIPEGTYILNDTPGAVESVINLKAINVTNKTLRIRGAGMGNTIIRRGAGTITANNQSLLRFCASAGGVVYLSDLTLDMDSEVGNITPGGALETNFTWQHNLCAEFRPQDELNSFDLIHCQNIEIRDPISDGLSYRGGLSTGAGCKKFVAINVRNNEWGLTTERPRVRGDITITGICNEIEIHGGRFPRLHLERDLTLSTNTISYVTINNAQIGEFLNHNPGNLASESGVPERIVTRIHGGSINYYMFAGCGLTTFNGTRIVNRSDGHHRLTEGDFTFNSCEFVVGAEYTGSTTNESGLFIATSIFPRDVRINGGHLEAESGAALPKSFLYFGDSGGGLTGTLTIKGFTSEPASMLLCLLQNSAWDISGVTSAYDGSHPWTAGMVFNYQSTAGGAKTGRFSGCRLTNSAAFLCTPTYADPGASGGIFTITIDGTNRVGEGKLVDLANPTFTDASTLYGTAWVYGRGSVIEASATWDPASIASGAQATTTITATGAALGDTVERSGFSLDQGGLLRHAYVSAANTVTFGFGNLTGGAVDLASGTARVAVRKT